MYTPTQIKRVISVAESFAAADAEDKAFWLSRTPLERLREIQELRLINYGHHAAARLQRVLEIAQRPQPE